MSDLITISNIKKYLHERFYNMQNLNSILNNLNEVLDPFSISYDPILLNINIKIKKSSLKRDNAYDNSSSWYYSIINPIMISFFNNSIITIGADIEQIGSLYNIEYKHLRNLIDPNLISQMYNITVCKNNIYIHL